VWLVPGVGIEPTRLAAGDFESVLKMKPVLTLRGVTSAFWIHIFPSVKTKCGYGCDYLTAFNSVAFWR
jgi:hypothetical protein